jgi:ribonuclease HI
MQLTIFTDGGSLNNPGQAATGYLIYEGKTLITKKGQAIGIATNNVAEYTGLISALSKVKRMIDEGTITHLDCISCFADSELMVKQLNGLYKVKNPDMRDLLMKVRMLENEINVPIFYTHVLRDKNKQADALVKEALGR